MKPDSAFDPCLAAKKLLREARSGALATLLLGSGDPYCSLVNVGTSVDGAPIKSANELTKKVQAAAPGSSIELSMVRDKKQSSLNVTLGQLTAQSRAPAGMPR